MILFRYEVAAFLPVLLPSLERAKEEVSDPECRNVCGKAHEQLVRTSTKPPVWKRIELAKVLATLEGLTRLPGKIKGLSDTVASHTAALALSMLDLKNLKAADWVATLKPILAHPGFDDADKVIASLLETCSKEVQVEEEKEEADDAEQLCDCQFSLAYGNKVLLNQTKLKLKRGYRYGLCGRNDSGKTSLMRAIANQQVEGFPPATELRTMYVETDVQGELAEVPVLDFVVNHEGLKGLGVTPEMAREKLLSVGFAVDDSTMAPASLTKEVGRLSGGWRMKLALVRAMLLKADILLLDEPTNHLDPGNVKWVIDYLTSLTHVTSIIVSHDIKVLDQVCTHVLQIDQLKLNMFKGNLTEVRRAFAFSTPTPHTAAPQPRTPPHTAAHATAPLSPRPPLRHVQVATKYVPDLMSYFELKATKFTMRFPQPGPLEGITSRGKHIMKMTNITFTYPTAPKPQLTVQPPQQPTPPQ